MSETNLPEGATNVANQKLESGAEHAKAALNAAADAGKAVSETVKQHAHSVYETGREHLSAAARDISEAGKAKYDELRGQATNIAGQYKSRAQSALSDAQAKAQGFQGDAETYVRENPLRAVAIALGVGFVLGALFRR